MIMPQFIINAMPEHIAEYAKDSAYLVDLGEKIDHCAFLVSVNDIVHSCKYFYETHVFEFIA